VDLARRAWDFPDAGPSVAGMGNRYVSAAYRELGGMLRQVREKAGLTATEVARMLGWPLTTISRMENGRRTSTTTDVIQYLVMCGLKVPEVKPIVAFARVAERKQGYYLSDERIGGSLQSLIFHESSAKHSIIYEPQVIHGLLQTPEYARALITAVNSDYTEDWVAGAVRTRMDRRRRGRATDPHLRMTECWSATPRTPPAPCSPSPPPPGSGFSSLADGSAQQVRCRVGAVGAAGEGVDHPVTISGCR
jgi:transcriptional regulator with XRE-family HTH domain